MKKGLWYSIFLLYTVSITCSATHTKTEPQTFSDWDTEWLPIYEKNKNTLDDPQKLADYFHKAIQENGTPPTLLKSLGLDVPFLFGASSSSYQVEGGIEDQNSWTVFLKNQNITIARNALQIWHTYIKEMFDTPVDVNTASENIKKWQAFLDAVNTNTVSNDNAVWARNAWEKLQSDILPLIQNKETKKEITTATNNKSIREFPGRATDFWHKYNSDTQLLGKHGFGLNAMRVSIEWSRIQPNEHEWNYDALAHYKEIISSMKEQGLEPLVVLHHYTIPTWFEHKGGFEKRENIDDFVTFATKVYESLGDQVTLWSTFNAIEGYAFKGYWRLEGPPAEKKDMLLTQQVMAHMLDSHVRIYRSFNMVYNQKFKHTNAPKPQIGIQKNIIPLDPSRGLLYLLNKLTASIGEHLQNDGFFNFFKTGRYTVRIPQKVFSSYEYPPSNEPAITDAPQSLDWVGLNHYSNASMYLAERVQEQDPYRKTNNTNYRYYPEGLYRATQQLYNGLVKDLEHTQQKKIPIIITENGLAIGDDEQRRETYFKQALFTIAYAIKQGYNIVGYTPWSATDNYEWGTFHKRYGLVHVDFTKEDLPRTIKKGAEFYSTFVKDFFNNK